MGTVWELDFYSRPVLDDQNKKRWEILICEGLQSVEDDPEKLFRYSKYVSNSEVNSETLQAAIEEAIAQSDAESADSPTKVRYFRYQMQNMIKRACEETGLLSYPSRRTLALQQWLEDRKTNFYPNDPGYKPSTSASVAKPIDVVNPLPDALLGQQWALVTLPAKDFADMGDWNVAFGEAFPLEATGVEPDTSIPGFIIYSNRATPLAAWMSGLEIAGVRAGKEESSNYVSNNTDTARLLMDTGTIETWLLADLVTPETQAEGLRFEQAKAAANNVHFIAVQESPESESFAGMWLMQAREFG
ncbi:Tab2/Atab2 family RNA-binding protein [cf. Phormidesmis sp. LEGE 11477]|uniref:Tab2/Atab2 family RNA-binding protein n=1 Tax=cf. Phormidesmis sp. LEGE 11477 TaxID=1828680 RepID=UPI001882D97B|nr:Tab2/Atab2 family RNA-binding protein [cf. Phormidesmis sp. LEGE 11477]MBE9060061.1 Tab2/Atab2 family RNA-binding protein [cf. Phormidesmis sp. LEGE 11477]